MHYLVNLCIIVLLMFLHLQVMAKDMASGKYLFNFSVWHDALLTPPVRLSKSEVSTPDTGHSSSQDMDMELEGSRQSSPSASSSSSDDSACNM